MPVQDKFQLFDDEKNRQVLDAVELIGSKNINIDEIVALSSGDAGDVVSKPPELPDSAINTGHLFVGDPSQPLVDPKEEDFVQIIVATNKPYVAYREAWGSMATRRTCSQQASRLVREPRVRERLRWLRQEKWRADKKVLDGDLPGGKTIGRAEKIAICESIMRDRHATVSDRMNALKIHESLLAGDGEAGKKSVADLDPVELCEYFRAAEAQGVDVVQAAVEGQDQGNETQAQPGAPEAI